MSKLLANSIRFVSKNAIQQRIKNPINFVSSRSFINMSSELKPAKQFNVNVLDNKLIISFDNTEIIPQIEPNKSYQVNHADAQTVMRILSTNNPSLEFLKQYSYTPYDDIFKILTKAGVACVAIGSIYIVSYCGMFFTSRLTEDYNKLHLEKTFGTKNK